MLYYYEAYHSYSLKNILDKLRVSGFKVKLVERRGENEVYWVGHLR